MPTAWQWDTAREFKIPASQAHTINYNKAQAYFKFISSKNERLNRFLNYLDDERDRLRQLEWMR